MDRENRNNRIAEVFEELATEITEEIIYLEDLQNLRPDVTTLDNINNQNTNEEENNSVENNSN
ncbi:MAG: hypothetical protein ACOCQS_02380 [Bacillota bacterium]